MVLTHEYWMKRFGGDASVVGKHVRLDGKSVTIVGVVQPAPYFPRPMDALLNMVISEHHTSALMVQGRTHRMTEMVARLAPGATVDQARAEVATINARVVKAYPQDVRSGVALPGRRPPVPGSPRRESAGSRCGCSWAPPRSS